MSTASSLSPSSVINLEGEGKREVPSTLDHVTCCSMAEGEGDWLNCKLDN